MVPFTQYIGDLIALATYGWIANRHRPGIDKYGTQVIENTTD